jgi:hypothetical protein
VRRKQQGISEGRVNRSLNALEFDSDRIRMVIRFDLDVSADRRPLTSLISAARSLIVCHHLVSVQSDW